MSGISSIFGSSGPSKEAKTAASVDSLAHKSSSEIKQQVQQQIAQEMAMTNATELVNKITSNCYEACIPNPGSSVSSAEQKCTQQCMEKYMHAWNLISRTYIARIQQASATGQI